MKFEGIYTPVITPFNGDGSVDEAGWAAMIDHLIRSGSHGIVVGGTTGEFYALSREERLRQFERAGEVVQGRVPWLAGVNDFRTEAVCAYVAAARDCGADALLLAAPPYSLPAEAELVSHCLAVDRAANLPIMLYNYPGRTGVMMGGEFLDGVVGHANFCAIKESSGEVDRIHLLAQNYPQLQLSCGADDQTLEFFAWGARSWVCAAANCAVAETVALYEACVVDGDFDRGRRLMSALLPLMALLERGGKFVQCVKYACELQGLPGGPVRQPLTPMDDALKGELHDILATAQAAVRELAPAQRATA